MWLRPAYEGKVGEFKRGEPHSVRPSKPNIKEDKMKELLLIVRQWVHLTATALWIGGIIFILFLAVIQTSE